MATEVTTPTPTETVKQGTISFDQAFDKAKDDAVKAATPAPAEPEAPPEEAVEAPAETTPEETEQQPEEETGPEAAPPQETSSEELLSDEEYNALKSDPKALRKALNRAFTQKSQEIAPYRKLIKAFETDPAGTLEQLARAQGYVLQKPGQNGTEQPSAPPPDELIQMATAELGPELAPILAGPLAKIAQKAAEKLVGPVQQNLEVQAAQHEAESGMAELESAHPDWKQFEPEMTRLSQVFQPAIGADGKPLVTMKEYTENLYQLASRNRSSAETTKRVVAKITKAAENAESPESGVSTNRVAPKPAGLPTLEQAWEAAKAGVRWES